MAMTNRQKKLLRLIFMVLGIVLLGVLISQIGIEEIGHRIRQVGLWFIPIVIISFCWFAVMGQAWRIILSGLGHRLSIGKLLKLKLAAEAINVVAPTANLGGEGFCILYLKKEMGVDIATGSVVLDKTTDNVAKMIFMVIGVLISILYVPIPENWVVLSILFLGGILLFNAITIFLQIGGVFGTTANILNKIPYLRRKLEQHRDSIANIDSHLKASYLDNRKMLYHSIGWQLIRRLLNVVEVWLIIWVLTGYTNPLDSVFIMSLTTVISNLFFLIPGQWGVAEGTQALLAGLVGFSASLGVSLGIIRRIRLMISTGVGLLLINRLK